MTMPARCCLLPTLAQFVQTNEAAEPARTQASTEFRSHRSADVPLQATQSAHSGFIGAVVYQPLEAAAGGCGLLMNLSQGIQVQL